MKCILVLAAVWSALAVAPGAFAETAVRPSLSALTQHLNGADLRCQNRADNARSLGARFPEERKAAARAATDCAAQAQADAQPLYKAAMNDEPRKEVQDGIKRMFVKWLAYMDTISGYEPKDRVAQHAFASTRVELYLDAPSE